MKKTIIEYITIAVIFYVLVTAIGLTPSWKDIHKNETNIDIRLDKCIDFCTDKCVDKDTL